MIKAADLRKLLDGKPDDWTVPISIAYGADVVDSVFVRLDEATVGTTKPKKPPGHSDGIGIFITLSLTDGEAEDTECRLCDNEMDDGNGDNWDGLCPGCADKVSAYMDMYRVSQDDAETAVFATNSAEGPKAP